MPSLSPDFRPDWAPLFLLEVDFLAKLVKSLLALFMPEVMCAVQGRSSVLGPFANRGLLNALSVPEHFLPGQLHPQLRCCSVNFTVYGP